MPELPEVEVVRSGLERHVVGRVIADVEVFHARAVRRHLAGAEHFAALLTGREIRAACRRGKYLWFPLDSGDVLLAHLGMSGQLLVLPPSAPGGPHLRARMRFADEGSELRFVDQRTFGGLDVEPLVPALNVPESVRHIARDPFDPAFDDAAFATALRRRRTGLKRALLDQTLVSGIGNIYADEALWRARLHWARPTATMTRPQIARVLAAAREVMTGALAQGGTSFDALYVDVDGESGYFDRSLEVYGRRDLPCSRCGSPIRRDEFMNRSSFSCPTCQRRPRRAHF
ncbi:bifunctional DNA-formamidopyrimidine glycosylase/DNA-(apurinic or apyrimidinic site) lyase [soil metagenome]